jgi:hypothetical protein
MHYNASTFMGDARTLLRSLSHAHVARLIASGTIFLYLVVFAILFAIASSHGSSPEKMIGLELPPYADTSEYRTLASNMMELGRFTINPLYPGEFARVPGYPAFFVVVLTVFGTLLVVPIIQIGFTAAAAALIYLIGVRYFPRSVALFAATLYVLDPIVMYATWIPISESLFMLLFLGSVYAVGSSSRQSWVGPLLGGALFGLSVYVRPIGFYLGPLIAAMTLAHSYGIRTALKNGAILLICAFLVMSPWMTRNYIEAGYFQFSSNRAWQLFAYNMALFEQARTGTSYEVIQKDYSAQFGTSDEKVLRQFDYSARLDAITKDKLLAHPIQYALFHTVKTLQLFVGSSIVNVTYHMHQFGILQGEYAHGEGAWGMILQHRWNDAFVQTFTHIPRLFERFAWMILYLLSWFAAGYAAFVRSRNRAWVLCAFVLMNAYAFMIGPGSDDTRYRIPTEPFLFLLAGFAVYTIMPSLKHNLRRVMRRSSRSVVATQRNSIPRS